MGIRLSPLCFPATGLPWIMQSSCTINQDQRSRLYRRSRKNFPLRRSFSTFFVTAGILLQKWWTVYSERILYGWGIKDQPNPLSMRDPSKSQCICPSFAENRPGCQPRDRWQPWILCIPLWRGVEWHSKCSGDPQLSEGWIWESQSIACISLYKCRVIHAGDPGHLYETVADWIIFRQSKVNLRWIVIKSDPVRESKGIGWSCRWSTICAVCILETTAHSKRDTHPWSSS